MERIMIEADESDLKKDKKTQEKPDSSSRKKNQESNTHENSTYYLDMAYLGRSWAKNLHQLIALELQQSIKSLKGIILLQVILFPILLFFYISFIFSLSYIVFTTFNTMIYALVCALILQAVSIVCINIAIKKLFTSVGFSHSYTQIKEAINGLSKAL